jgi:hypothetical protein
VGGGFLSRIGRQLLGGLLLVALAAGGAAAAIAKTDQTITVTVHAPATGYYEDAFLVSANASSGLPVSYSSAGPCSNAGNRFQMTSGTGTCVVQYDQSGDATYNAAPQVVEQVVAQKSDQLIEFDALDGSTYGDPDFDVDAFASSELPVAFAAGGKCTLSGNTLHITGAGSCTVTATQAGDANFNAAPPVAQSFTIAKADQDITFLALEPRVYGDSDFLVKATADSGLAVSFSAHGACTVRGRRVHLTRPGKCKITASQSGDANYNAAPAVSQTFAVARPVCFVPNVRGKRLAAAKLALARSHCAAGKVSRASSRAARGRVVSQSRRPGRQLPAGSRVDLVVSRGRR